MAWVEWLARVPLSVVRRQDPRFDERSNGAVGREGLSTEIEIHVIRSVHPQPVPLDTRHRAASGVLGARENIAGVVERVHDVGAEPQRHRGLEPAQVDRPNPAEVRARRVAVDAHGARAVDEPELRE